MASDKNIKLMRDRFLGFAFASADLFLEISKDGLVTFTLGAAKGMTGIDDKTLQGKNWLDLFSKIDRPVLRNMELGATVGKRCGPIIATFDKEIVEDKQAIVTGIKMPGMDSFFVTLGVSGPLMARLAESMKKDMEEDLLDRERFTEAAQEAVAGAKLMKQDVDLTLLDFAPTEEDRARMGEENWNALLEGIGHLLKSKSIDGRTAGEIGDGRYSVLHDKSVSAESIKEQLQILAQENDPEGSGINVEAKTVSSDLDTLTERDATRAIVYTINEFERKGSEMTIDKLNNGFDEYLAANAQKVKEFQSFIERQSFTFAYQPIVDLNTMDVTHYEILSRFNEGDTQEWVMFGEDMGLAAEFDLAVCERAIHFLTFKVGGTRTKYSINISGQSIDDENFFSKLVEMLDKHDNIADRLMFEITESTHINDLDRVNRFVHDLQGKGYTVALDDFGAGSASFQYIQSLDVNYVKIDGKYTRKLLTSQRDVAMVKNLTQMCKDLGIKVIAEFVEDMDQVEVLRKMGVEYGQGYLFGKPEPNPQYSKPPGV